jgi:hypothetical protein
MEFPPYGVAPKKFFDGITMSEEVTEVCKKLIEIIDNHIWPFRSQTQKQQEIVEADLRVCRALVEQLENQPLSKFPKRTHKNYYIREDRDENPSLWGSGRQRVARCILEYLQPKPENHHEQVCWNDLEKSLIPYIENGISESMPYLSYLKKGIQRCRPNQAAYIVKEPNFSWEVTLGGHTPSMPSGHCWQGLMMYLKIANSDFLERLSEKKEVSLENLARACVDHGDRRVFAGVHYPSDNVASWLGVFLTLGYQKPGTYSDASIKVLAEAIKQGKVWEQLSKQNRLAAITGELTGELQQFFGA